MKCSRFPKIFRGEEKCHFQRAYIENITGDRDASTENDHQHKMKHGHFKRHRMEHHFFKHRRFGHGHLKNHRHHDMEHDFRKDYSMRRGHHKMNNDLPVYHGMEHGRHMHQKMKHGFSRLHKIRHGHMKLHKIARLFKHHRMCHKVNHDMHQKMKSNLEDGDSDEHHVMNQVKRIYPGKSGKEFDNSKRCPEDRNQSCEDEIRTYPSKSDAQVTTENNKFQISMNTSSYQPEEICVKVVKGKIDISALHESVDDDIYEFHEMYRSFTLPENVNPENVSSRLESDGKLIVEVPINSPEERDISITRQSEE